MNRPMNRYVNAIAARLSLRPPQRRSLEILDRVTEILPPRKQSDLKAALELIRSEYPDLMDFERAFPSESPRFCRRPIGPCYATISCESWLRKFEHLG